MTSHKTCDFSHVLNYATVEDKAVQSNGLPEGWSDEDIAELAAKEWEAWKPEATSLPSQADWAHIAMVVRMAFAINCKTKGALVELCKEPDDDGAMAALVEDLLKMEKNIESVGLIIKAAFARLMAAGCAYEVEKAQQCA